MPKQYGSNGINSDGSCMNVGNTIWNPVNGGRPSIRVYQEKMKRTPVPWGVDDEHQEIQPVARDIITNKKG